mgnify:CR=1 FL=1
MKNKKLVCYFIFLNLLLISNRSFAQPMQYDAKFVDSITKRLPTSPDDTSKVNNLIQLAAMHIFINPELTIKYAKEGAAIAEKIHYHTGRIGCLGQSAFSYAISGDWVKATIDVNEAIPLCEKYKPDDMVYMSNLMVIISGTKGDNEQALEWAQKATRVPAFSARTELEKWPTYMQLGRINEALNRLDSAKYYADIVLRNIKKYAQVAPELTRDSYTLLGNIAFKQKQYQQSIEYYRLAGNSTGLANLYHSMQQSDSAVYYGLKGLHDGQIQNNPGIIQSTSKILAAEFGKSNPEEANRYLNIYVASKDSLYNVEKLKQFEELRLNGQRNEYEIKIKETANRNRFMLYSLFIVLAFLSVLILLIWRNNRFKQRANKKLESSYNNLKSAQAQLIQAEKMASLGELTAGIAHEIQNPLNFVNNFSEVSKELLIEMKDELAIGNFQLANEIASDVEQNLEKIHHHGKRADAIVKGMLQHCRISTGKKEPTDINALCDEYLRLAFHGLKARDNSFKASFRFEPDNTLPKMNLVPQDIGRVLLNLINNAFQAVHEKSLQGIDGYTPTVILKTKKPPSGGLEVTITDNGPGIPGSIKDKIFQPFFTTKPSGQGTGLGLSLSYDIVKAHGGALNVESPPAYRTGKEGEGSTFIIHLPVQEN